MKSANFYRLVECNDLEYIYKLLFKYMYYSMAISTP